MSLIVLTPGLNQVYYTDPPVNCYSELVENMFGEYNTADLTEDLVRKILKENVKVSFFFDCLDFIKDLREVTVYLYSENPLHRLIDSILTEDLGFKVVEDISVFEKEKSVLFSYSNKQLLNKGFFTFLLVGPVHTSNSKELTAADREVEVNQESIKSEGKGYIFTSSYFFHEKLLFSWIVDFESGNKKEYLLSKIAETKAIKVQVFPKLQISLKKYSKSKFYIRTEQIFYSFYCGILEEDQNILLTRSLSKFELEKYSDLMKDISKAKCKIIGNPLNLALISSRIGMANLIQAFCGSEAIKSVCAKFKETLDIPPFCSGDQAEKLTFPIILKSDGDTEKLSHTLSFIPSKEYLPSVLAQFPKNTNLLAQSFVEHNKKLLKFYYVGGKIFYFVRSSIGSDKKPIIFETNQIYSESTEIDLNLPFLTAVTEEFSVFFKEQIFGLDLIKSENQVYHLIDVNYFPGFKEMKDTFSTVLSDFLLSQ